MSDSNTKGRSNLIAGYVLGAGALAAAVVSIFDLWDSVWKFAKPNDVRAFELCNHNEECVAENKKFLRFLENKKGDRSKIKISYYYSAKSDFFKKYDQNSEEWEHCDADFAEMELLQNQTLLFLPHKNKPCDDYPYLIVNTDRVYFSTEFPASVDVFIEGEFVITKLPVLPVEDPLRFNSDEVFVLNSPN